MKLENRKTRWLAVLTAVAIVGCEANHYEIEMRPTGETIQRELTCWREHTSNDETVLSAFPEDELARIATAYDAAVPNETASKHKFVSEFTGQLPKDVGGSGSYTHWDTALGSVSGYVERFRGDDDVLADVESRHQAADRFTDLLIDWLASELEGEAGFAELSEFLEKGFRRDLKNLILYSWACGFAGQEEDDAQSECAVRAGQYLVERSYFTADQLPALARAWQSLDGDGPARFVTHLQRFMASKMGIAADQPIPTCLRFLADVTVVNTSINEYLRQTDEFKHLLEEWDRERATNPELQQPEPEAVIGELFVEAFLPSFDIGRSDQLRVKVLTTTEPFLTNGQWDAQASQVRWSRDMLSTDAKSPAVPTLLYAIWSSPDEQAQTARFGRVVLEGTALGNYCLWYRGLAEQEAKEWNEFFSSLQPSDDLIERLGAFRFAHEPLARDGEEQPSHLAATPRELILHGLTGDATPQ